MFLNQESSHHTVLDAEVAQRTSVGSVNGSFSLLGVDEFSLGHLLDALDGSTAIAAFGDGSLLGDVLDDVSSTRGLYDTTSVRTGVVRLVLSESNSAVFSHD